MTWPFLCLFISTPHTTESPTQQLQNLWGKGNGAIFEVLEIILLDEILFISVIDHQSGRLLQSLAAGVSQPVEAPKGRSVTNMEIAHWINGPEPLLFLPKINGPISLCREKKEEKGKS